MSPSHARAAWLLERLGVDVALAGDLLEERARGRSAVWYWRQVMVATWLGIWRAILEHKLLALRAVATGCAVSYTLSFVFARLLQPVLPPGTSPTRAWIIGLSLILLTQSVTGWIIARTHRDHPVPMASAFATFLVLWNVIRNLSVSYTWTLLVDSLDQPRFRLYLLRHLAAIFVPSFAVVLSLHLGAIAAVSRPARPRTH